MLITSKSKSILRLNQLPESAAKSSAINPNDISTLSPGGGSACSIIANQFLLALQETNQESTRTILDIRVLNHLTIDLQNIYLFFDILPCIDNI